jgi:hypothetical protein
VDFDCRTGPVSHGQDFGSRLIYVVQKLHAVSFVGVIQFCWFSFPYTFVFCCICATIDSKRS